MIEIFGVMEKSGEDYGSESSHLLRSTNDEKEKEKEKEKENENDGVVVVSQDLESQRSTSNSHSQPNSSRSALLKDLFTRHFDPPFSPRRISFKRREREPERDREGEGEGVDSDVLGDSAPPEWALLLIGCLLGLATGLLVAAFNNGVYLSIYMPFAFASNKHINIYLCISGPRYS